MKKAILNILFMIYIVIAIILTLLLLSYNEFKVTEIGGYSLVLVKDNVLAPDFNRGDLVIVNKDDPIEIGKAFFYDSYNQKIEVALGVVVGSEKVTERETAYMLEGEKEISGQYVLGPANTAEIIPNAGTVLSILESKWGFLFLIVLPALIAVINQIGVVYSGVKEARREEKASIKREEQVKETVEK